MIKMRYLIIIFFSIAGYSFAQDEFNGIFSGRVAKINQEASLIRVKTDFDNMRYLNKKDQLELWTQENSMLRCKGYLLGKTAEFLLIKVPDFIDCIRTVAVVNGGYLMFYSKDLVNNLKMGSEVQDVLLKKRLAIAGKLQRSRKELDSYIEKTSAINERYQILKDKLELEWNKELSFLEEDKTTELKNFKQLEAMLDDIDHKLEQYRVKDKNLVLDKWALDSKQYYLK